MKIREAVPILVERLQKQKIILFVGAGLSRASGLPDWKKLFEPLCKKLECPDEDDYPAVASAVIDERIHNRNEIIEHIVKQICNVDFELNPNHHLIKRLPFKIIITTNYDNLLEELYGATKLKRIYSNEGMAYFDPQSSKIQLIYLHGDVNHPEHMVITSIDYRDFSDTRPIMVERLQTLLQEYTFLFIGYSANDPNLHAIFDHFKITYKKDARRHFIALTDPGKVKQTELRTRFGIEPIILKHYNELTVFLENLADAYENPGNTGAFDISFNTSPSRGLEQFQVVSPSTNLRKGNTFDNPYFTGRPIQDSHMYFGRKDVLERIKQRLGPNNIIILYGQRRTGKTSSLYQLKNQVYKNIAIPVILDIQSMLGDDTEFFFYRMAADLYETLKLETNIHTDLLEPGIDDFKSHPQYKLETFLKKALKEVKDKPIIYLIDEFDGLFQMIKEKKVEPVVLDNLRSIMQHYQQVWFLLAGTHLIKQEAADSRSALFNIATYEKIGALDEKDARDLIIQPVKGQIEYEPYAVDKIISLTNCNPYFIQAICFELVFYLETRQLSKAAIKDLNVVVKDMFNKGSSHFDQFRRYLPKSEGLFLSLLAENTREYESFISIDRAREFCKGWFDPGMDINKIISQLEEKDLIIRKNYLGKSHIGFFMELFKGWILMHHPSDSYE